MMSTRFRHPSSQIPGWARQCRRVVGGTDRRRLKGGDRGSSPRPIALVPWAWATGTTSAPAFGSTAWLHICLVYSGYHSHLSILRPWNGNSLTVPKSFWACGQLLPERSLGSGQS